MLTDPIAEYYKITQWLSQLIGVSLTPKQFTQRLRSFFKKHHITIDAVCTDILDTNDFTISALYDVWGDEDGKNPIAFTFYINHPLDELWLINSDTAEALALELIEALTHEYQHVYQYRMRNYILNAEYTSTEEDSELRANQEYLGQMDEIDAYAMNIAVRFYIRNDQTSQDLDKYREAFGSDHWVVRRLLKKITKRLAYLETLDSRRTLAGT